MAVLSKIKASDNVDYNIRDDYSTWGGRNLLLDTKAEKSQVYNSTNLMRWVFAFDGNLPVGEYTVSCDIKSSNGTDKFYISVANDSSTVTQIANTIVPTTTYTRWNKTFSYSATSTTNCIFITSCVNHGGTINSGNNGTIYIKNIKLERSNKPTDWSPAPEDIAKFIGNETIELYG